MTSSRDSDLVSTVAHELRAPVAAVRAVAAAIAGADEPTRDRLVRVLLDAADQLTLLLDDLLTSARLDAGALHVSPRPCDVAEVVHEAAAVVEAVGASVRIDVAAGLPLAEADPQRLRQVVTNLVANGHAHGGGIVEIRADAAPGLVRVAVSDDGPGIPVGERAHVFDRFARLPGGAVHGTGLGLSIARQLTEAMGGAITVEAREPRGTTFTVTLRRAGAAS